MYLKKFLVVEPGLRLYLSKYCLYGYNYHNQSIYKAGFSDKIQDAKQFSSLKEANQFLDHLISDEYNISVLNYRNTPIRLANLSVQSVSISYDA